MECPKCKTEMCGDTMIMMPFAVQNTSRKILDGNKQSNVKCYGCPQCGYMEFYAEDPKVFGKQG